MIANLITPGTTAFMALCVAAYILLANALAYAAFAIDKSRAIRAQARIPERSLLILASLGGWIGAKIAQHRLRHKTRKQPFGILLNLSVLIIPGLIATAVSDRATRRATPRGFRVAPELGGSGQAVGQGGRQIAGVVGSA